MHTQITKWAGLTRRMTSWATPATTGPDMEEGEIADLSELIDARDARRMEDARQTAQRLQIPVRESTADDEECARLRNQGQFLARQDRWSDLSAKIRMSEAQRSKTPGGMPVSDLLTFGARSDVVAAAEHAIAEGVPSGSPALLSGIGGLEDVLAEFPSDPAIALTVAQAHLDIGWAWRGSDPERDIPKASKAAFAAHFDRASDILDRFNGVELDSPALAAARCALLPGLRDPNARVADDYEDLIDLDPSNERHMRAMGNHLLPRWFGDYDQLELEARRTASRTQDIWGNAGYTWVMFDAIANDDTACARVDTEFFIDGLSDILKRRPDQATANLLAAYCAVALGNRSDAAPIAACADWVIRDHLVEVHPLIWAHAAKGFDNAAPVTSLRRFAAYGQAQALKVLDDLFREEISEGQQVIFTPNGVQISA